MTDYASYSNQHMMMNYGMTMPPSPTMAPSMVDPNAAVCMCPDCDYYRTWGVPAAPMQQQQQQQPVAPMPRKYSHNPYAPGPSMGSAPPVITAGDAIASIVPNVNDYVDVYGAPQQHMYAQPQPQQHLMSHHHHHAQQHHAHHQHMPIQQQQQQQQGYTLQEQFSTAIGMIADLACTPRGRSMLQAVLRLRQAEQVQAILAEVTATEDTIARLMLDSNACHVIRALIEVLDTTDINAIASSVVMSEALVLQLATTSQHTRRILQSLFEHFSSERCCEDVTAILAGHAQYLATTQQGCIALMRVVENAAPAQRDAIHENLFPTMTNLAMDPYGNYVIQHMIERGDQGLISDAVVTHVIPNAVVLCCNKFASNVMEKVFYAITPAARRALLDSILYSQNSNALHVLMHDSYGNFVVQAAIESCQNFPEFRRITERMRPLIHTSPYGHKIEAKLKSKRIGNGPQPPRGPSSLNSSMVCSNPSTAPSTPTTIPLDATAPLLGPVLDAEDLSCLQACGSFP